MIKKKEGRAISVFFVSLEIRTWRAFAFTGEEGTFSQCEQMVEVKFNDQKAQYDYGRRQMW